MNEDATSLDRLHDIIEPVAAMWWPLAPGLQIVFALSALLLAIALLRGFISWQHNRYRREALTQLKHLLSARDKPANDCERLAAIAALLKRTAITAFSRDKVAASNGSEWFAFLDQSGGTNFSAGLGAALEHANYIRNDAWNAAQLQQLGIAVRHWIKHHKVEVVNPQTSVMTEARR
jgi:hypothetical protein